MKLAIAQINSVLGDIQGNTRKIIRYMKEAKRLDVDLVAFPELAITGYPPQDLLYDENFILENKRLLQTIVKWSLGITVVIGFVDRNPRKKNYEGLPVLYNAAAVVSDGQILGTQYKTLLPTYDVFNETRYFEPAQQNRLFRVNGVKMGVQVCEDMWDDPYDTKVSAILTQKGANIIVNISASPFYSGKRFDRLKLLQKHARNNSIPILYANLVGGQDGLVFDGESLVVDKTGNLIAIGKQFEEDLVITEINLVDGIGKEVKLPRYDRDGEIFLALTLGLRDYCLKNGFKKVILGLSGGIDSSVTAAIASEAMGAKNVLGISMPSIYTSNLSNTLASEQASNLGIDYKVRPIQDIVKAQKDVLLKEFSICVNDVVEENLQVRIRGIILMALSNMWGYLVLATGNKTELALGYCTLYGDMVGGIGVLSDVSKTQVYKLASYVNKKYGRDIIPRDAITRRPTAELREGQLDPFDYDVISPLVDEIIENRRSIMQLIKLGYRKKDIKETMTKIRRAEHKRWQAAPGIKITKRAFGIGRKMPISNQYRHRFDSGI